MVHCVVFIYLILLIIYQQQSSICVVICCTYIHTGRARIHTLLVVSQEQLQFLKAHLHIFNSFRRFWPNTHTQYYIILQNIKLFKSNVYIHYTNLSMVLLVLLSPEPDPRPSRTDCTMAKGRMGGSVQTPQETSSLHLCTPGLTGSSLIIIGHLSLYEQAMLQRIIKHYLFNTKMRTQDVKYIHMPQDSYIK